MSKFNYKPLLALLVALGLILTFANLGEAAPKTKAERNFWTSDRMKKAVAYEMVFDKGKRIAKRTPTAAFSSSKPWTAGGLPATASGKIFFAIGENYYTCSGSLVTDGITTRAVVLTAAHCAYELGSYDNFVDHWVFIPNYDANPVYDCTGSSNGRCWYASALVVNSGYANESAFTLAATTHDWAFAVISPYNEELPDLEGNSFDISFNPISSGMNVHDYGYSVQGKYKGARLLYCDGFVAEDIKANYQTLSLACDLTGGSSGGPWLRDFLLGDPYSGILTSVNSYKYNSTPKMIFGPKFNSETELTFAAALIATDNLIAG